MFNRGQACSSVYNISHIQSHTVWLQKVGSNGATLPPKCKGLTPNQNIHLSNLCSSKLTELKYEFWSYWLAPKIFKHFTVELNSISMQPILVPLESRHACSVDCV